MSEPTRYLPGFNYSGWEADHPTEPKPGAELDNDFAHIRHSIDETIRALRDVRRSDGKIQNTAVDFDALSPAVKAAIANSDFDYEVIEDLLAKQANLLDLPDKAEAIENLGALGRDANLSDLTNLKEARSNLGEFATIADVQNSHIPAVLERITVGGYHYISTDTEPSHAGKVRDDGGRWFELAEGTVEAAMFGADGVDDTQAVQDAFDFCVAAGAVYDGAGIERLISSTLQLPAGLKARNLNFRAIGTGWSANSADPDSNTVGLPLIESPGVSAVEINGLTYDCGLTTIDPVNQNIAAAGVLIGGAHNNENHRWRDVVGVHYNGYGFWVRSRFGDSSIDNMRVSQWIWGEAGWYDVSKRTAYGIVNSRGDFKAYGVTPHFNKANILVLDGAFATQWIEPHPYNGSDEAATLPNIIIQGGNGQQFNGMYMDNGGIVLRSFDHQFKGIRVVRGEATSGHFPVFELVATSVGEDAWGLSIEDVEVPVNEFIKYSSEGAGSWKRKKAHIIRGVFRRTPSGLKESDSNYPLWGLMFRQNDSAYSNGVLIDNSPGNATVPTVANRRGALEILDNGFSGGINIASYSNDSNHFPAIRTGKARGEFLGSTPLAETTLFEMWSTGTNGTHFGQPYNGGAGYRVVTEEDWSPSAMGARLDFYVTTPGSAARHAAYSMKGDGFVPLDDDVKALGGPDNLWSELFAGNGSINTSDGRMKRDIQEIPDAVLDAWSEVPKRMFRWKSAYEEKGDHARWHFGVISQDVVAAFQSHGLDATRYGVLCYDAWPEQVVHHPAETEPVLDEDGEPVTEEQRDENGDVVMAPQKVEYIDEEGISRVRTEDRPVMVPKMRVIQEAWDEVIPAGNRYGVRYTQAAQLDAALDRRERGRLVTRLEALEGYQPSA